MTATVAVLDYGSGNLRSAERALAATGAHVVVTADHRLAREADGLVVPGVGAFAACMAGIRAIGGEDVVQERVAEGRATFGICVGMQILYNVGDEHGVHTAGIGVLRGAVSKLHAPVLPHMGWNDIALPAPGSPLLHGVETERFYFVHSYGVDAGNGGATPDGVTESVSEHGESRFVSVVEAGRLCATQFHPEKSGAAGARLLRNWVATLRAS